MFESLLDFRQLASGLSKILGANFHKCVAGSKVLVHSEKVVKLSLNFLLLNLV